MPINPAFIDIINRYKLTVCGEIVEDPAGDGTIYTPILISRGSDGKNFPSGKTLSEIRNLSRLLELSVRFILIDSDPERPFESRVRSSLINSFPDEIRNAFVSEDSETHIWVESKTSLDDGVILNINNLIDEIIKDYETKEFVVHMLFDANTPTNMQILSVIRRYAPISSADLSEKLTARGRIVPTRTWLQHRLDSLRKTGQVIKKKNQTYAVSLSTLSAMGSGKQRTSPDVMRLLALARGQ